MHDGECIGIERALKLREETARNEKPEFTCVECHEPVRAHKAGISGAAAHFEHLKGNVECSLRMPKQDQR